MKGNKTLTIIKPVAVQNGYVGPILNKIHDAGFTIKAIKSLHLSTIQAENFYIVHKGKHFYNDLVNFMISGPIIVAILEKENAVEDYRKLIGATNPLEAADGTLRKLFGTNLRANAVHGSDCDENAEIECDFFFSEMDRM